MIIVGQAALARPDGAAVLAALLAPRRRGRRAGRRLARLQRAAHRGGARRRAGPRLRPGPQRQEPRAHAGRRRRRAVAAGRRRIRHRPHRRRHLRHLPGPSRRCRRPPRRRDPAGRGLHREARHLRQHRRPRAARRSARSIRRARRARTGRSCAPSATSIGHRLPYDNIDALRARLGAGEPGVRQDRLPAALRLRPIGPAPPAIPPLWATRRSRPHIANYYQTDPISRASPTMAACTDSAAGPALAAAE